MRISRVTHASHWVHPLTLFLVSFEHASSFLHVFNSQKEAYSEHSRSDLAASFAMADGSIDTMKAFSDLPRGICWAHIVRNDDRKLLEARELERRKMFR